ncbi:hypothetical protein TanjilG_11654 [Lupinus angustifolius]|uniref:Uncharacterized protein n=1 Tax=Lupinus angustifolius TaxID=3871 RepID=A0A1J7GZC0_LUPAN|nr:PREDICTED: autophagy-related protein 18f-like isoform X1 [Lupinus angustifolius]XP_019453654.1 PREDICTED: autophagy-related protein 18f-like isoform X1 [Lupinus angustifolius]OIW05967.1 hypothetical protein TanjilG_11654 [Lupinus angustifolius]
MFEFKDCVFEYSVLNPLLLLLWVAVVFISLILGMSNNNDGHKQQHLHGGVGNGVRANSNNNRFLPGSFRAFSNYLKVVSSGASTVARSAAASAASVASAIVDRDGDADHNQVIWAGFDKLEGEGGVVRQVLLLGYRFGFQVWDFDDSNNVRDLVSRQDGPVSFMQMVPSPIVSKRPEDKFAGRRPLLVVCTDGFFAGGGNVQDGVTPPSNGGTANYQEQVNGNYLPTTVHFYSMRTQSYVHVLKFRSAVYSVRCSSRIVAVSQTTQIHCFDATTLERGYILCTNPIVLSCPSFGGIGYGPLAVGPRWLAYSGSPVAVSTSGRVSPQHLTPSASFPGFSSNGSLVAHYAKESSKHLACRIVTLGDMGYKKLSRYCSELLPDSNDYLQHVNSASRSNGVSNGHSPDVDDIGMVIVKDIISKNIVSQFRAHKSPISALCFDPSGTILVTASVQGHNINVFKIMPGCDILSASDASPSHVHLYRLQRGFTNAVIQDISFSVDSKWIMISSSRGTNHLFAINPQGGPVNIQPYDDSFTANNGGSGVMTNQAVHCPVQTYKQQSLCAGGPPITLSVVSRIRSGSNGWRGTVTGAAAAATGRMSSLSGAVASSFHNFKGSSALYVEGNHSMEKYYLLVFSPSGSMIQYALHLQTFNGLDSVVVSGLAPAYEAAPQTDPRVIVDAVQKWNISKRNSWRQQADNIDIYGENGISDCNKIYPEEEKGDNITTPKIKNVLKVNSRPKVKHNLYISEAELQMHEAGTPLWAKAEIYFHSMGKEAIMMMNKEAASGGETEIERIPTRMIEARPKDLVPIFDYIQTPKFQHTRTPAVDNKLDEQMLHQSSGLFERGSSSPSSIFGSPEYMITSNGAIDEFKSGFEGNEWDDHLILAETKGFVNNNDTLKPKTIHEIVDNKIEHLNMEAQLMFVNSDNESLKMKNPFEEKGDESD